MTDFKVKYQIYFLKNQHLHNGEIIIEDGVTFKDNRGRKIIVVEEGDAIHYLKNVYEKDIFISIKSQCKKLWFVLYVDCFVLKQKHNKF